jgi:GNAT superfamily N-acetyltransferase
MAPNPGAETENHVYVSNPYVEPSRQGAGLGSMLMDTCLRLRR